MPQLADFALQPRQDHPRWLDRDVRHEIGHSALRALCDQVPDLHEESFLPVRPPRGDAENAVENSGWRRLYLFGHSPGGYKIGDGWPPPAFGPAEARRLDPTAREMTL